MVLVGEMRDLETIEAALTLAETATLCFATLHTNSCVQTITECVDVFPPYQRDTGRAPSFPSPWRGSFPGPDPQGHGQGARPGPGDNDPHRGHPGNLIREDKLHQIYIQMQVGQKKFACRP